MYKAFVHFHFFDFSLHIIVIRFLVKLWLKLLAIEFRSLSPTAFFIIRYWYLFVFTPQFITASSASNSCISFKQFFIIQANGLNHWNIITASTNSISHECPALTCVLSCIRISCAPSFISCEETTTQPNQLKGISSPSCRRNFMPSTPYNKESTGRARLIILNSCTYLTIWRTSNTATPIIYITETIDNQSNGTPSTDGVAFILSPTTDSAAISPNSNPFKSSSDNPISTFSSADRIAAKRENGDSIPILTAGNTIEHATMPSNR